MNKKSGFSLLVVLLSLAGVTGLSLTLAEISSVGTRVANNAASDRDIIDLRTEIDFVLAEEESCTPIFDGLEVRPGLLPHGDEFYLHNISGEPFNIRNLEVKASIVEMLDKTDGSCDATKSECLFASRILVQARKTGYISGAPIVPFQKLVFLRTEGEDPDNPRSVLGCSSSAPETSESETSNIQIVETLIQIEAVNCTSDNCWWKQVHDGNQVWPLVPNPCSEDNCRVASINDATLCHSSIQRILLNDHDHFNRFDYFRSLFPNNEVVSLELIKYQSGFPNVPPAKDINGSCTGTTFINGVATYAVGLK